ncbi:hypothetical protein [Amycolatopsis sp. NPDC051903]|uniref:hypothetical protein n=1 Tax=Amycolatopsis sp. NPDC051903 TaxID=3363936 RepID=UPI00378A2695
MTDLSRVRVSFSGAPATADYAVVERSTDGLNWTTVRGGDVVPLAPGFLDDYEFTAGVLNTYRVSFVDSGPITSVPSPGTTVTGDNTNLTPPLPATGLLPGDTMFLFASIGSVSGTDVNTPTGWTKIVDFGNVALFSKRYVTGDTAPTVSFTGGVSGSDVMAQVTAFHNASQFPRSVAKNDNGSNQNVALPALNVDTPATLNLWLAWKQNAWTGATTGRGFAEIGDWTSAIGATTSAMWWEYTVQAPDAEISFTPTNLTVTGGSAAVSKGVSLFFGKQDYITQATATVTPMLDTAWLKNPRRPSLNTAVIVSEVGPLSRDSRSGTFDVIGRTMPVVVSDVASSRKFSLTIMVDDADGASDLDARLAAGDALFLQTPDPDSVVPTLYFVTSGYSWRRTSHRGKRRFFDLDVVEVSIPAPTVYGGTITYADLPGLYASYNTVASSVSTYFNLMDLVVQAEVIVP